MRTGRQLENLQLGDLELRTQLRNVRLQLVARALNTTLLDLHGLAAVHLNEDSQRSMAPLITLG